MPHQASAAEALFLSNHPTLLELSAPKSENLSARLLKLERDDALLDEAFRTLVGRKPRDDERAAVQSRLKRKADRAAAVSALVWSLVTSAEFRFNH
jgi:hypothetical protein